MDIGGAGLTAHPPRDARDLVAIAALYRAAPPLQRHRLDFPWRLSSLGEEAADDVRLWTTADGVIVGFAAWYPPWATFDFVVRPGPSAGAVEAAIFAWAIARFRAIDGARGYPLPYWAEAHTDDTARFALLAHHGFTLDDDDAYVMLRRSLPAPLPPPTLPMGFVIRPLDGEREVAAYVALHRSAFHSAAMTAAWRSRTLQMPGYRADLDLVLVAPDGTLAGFSVGWLAPEEHAAQIEPFGIAPAFRRRGLGRALLAETLRRFQAHGATQAQVETESTRSPARHAYEAAGFRVAGRAVRKGRWGSRE